MTAIIAFLKKWILYAIGLIFIILIVFIKGCSYGKSRVVCPTIITGTTLKVDTVTHYVYNIWPWYVQGEKEVIEVPIPTVVDTAFILRDYFAKHVFNREWKDSLLAVQMIDTISRNKPVGNAFSYKILRPQSITYTTVDNSVHYAKYLYVGGSIPVNDIKYADFGLFYAFPAGLVGAGYNPALKSVQVTGALKLFKFK